MRVHRERSARMKIRSARPLGAWIGGMRIGGELEAPRQLGGLCLYSLAYLSLEEGLYPRDEEGEVAKWRTFILFTLTLTLTFERMGFGRPLGRIRSPAAIALKEARLATPSSLCSPSQKLNSHPTFMHTVEHRHRLPRPRSLWSFFSPAGNLSRSS
jgi:hypothetical protein